MSRSPSPLPLVFSKGSTGRAVGTLAKALKIALRDDAWRHPVLARPGSLLDSPHEAAIRTWQAGAGLVADGVVGPYGQTLLGLATPAAESPGPWGLSIARITPLFPQTKPANIARYLPYLTAALAACNLPERSQALGSLALLRAHAEGFVPLSETVSPDNTAPGGALFGLNDRRGGNGQRGDGARYRKRGWTGLTGRSAYQVESEFLGCDLVSHPEYANSPEIAALVLAHTVDVLWRAGTEDTFVARLRALVNPQDAGALERFDAVWRSAEGTAAWAAPALAATRSRGAARRSTGPSGNSSGVEPSRGTPPAKGRTAATPVSRSTVGSGTRARKDTVDVRDRLYTPPPVSLPPVHPSPTDVARFLPAYTQAGLILNQGQEGSCTGFGLACVINYLRWLRAARPKKLTSVSPHMLYTMARRFDEYEGEDYDGSSCRGAIKGWFYNGVCSLEDWTDAPRYGFAERAVATTLGVYYRIDITSITDLQAAICQHGAIYVSVYTHGGWDDVPWKCEQIVRHEDVPVIGFDGHPHRSDGHAFALIGFNESGFLLQNSWGADWGAGGFATLSYADWLTNAMDAWVVALGVPRVVAGRLAVPSATVKRAQHKEEKTAGSAPRQGWWDEAQALQHSLLLGDDGRVSRYLTEDAAPRKLLHQVFSLPDRWFSTLPPDQPKRLVIYAHGGLNSEADAVSRARALGRYFLGNGCYPLFVVWKTGLWESLQGVLSKLRDQITSPQGIPAATSAAARTWSDTSDLLIEKWVGRPAGRPLWCEMKDNAALAFTPRRAGDLLLEGLLALASRWNADFELHLVGHSAGSIWLGHLLRRMSDPSWNGLQERVQSTHLFAPACTVDFANQHFAAVPSAMRGLQMELLSDSIERKDNVASVYRRSLLYLVSNALESDLRTPLLGLASIYGSDAGRWNGNSDTMDALASWRQALGRVQSDKSDRLRLQTESSYRTAIDADGEPVLETASHGGFDNDIDVMTRTLSRITGMSSLPLPITDLRSF
jgi:hypothetical protein